MIDASIMTAACLSALGKFMEGFPMSDSEELMQDQDRIEAYRQLKERADKMGFACVNEALDRLVELMGD